MFFEAKGFTEACAKSHANAVEGAGKLRRPYIFSCHSRLVGWAIPLFGNEEQLAAVIICGGVLLTEPDSALISHMESVAAAHGIDPVALVDSLGSVPVISRERLRAVADFLFELSNAFLEYVPSPEEAFQPPEATLQPITPQAPIVFPPVRRQQTKKAKRREARTRARQSEESEIVRLLRERKPDDALQALRTLLLEQGDRFETSGTGPNLNVAEIFVRMFRNLVEDQQLSRRLLDKQSHLVREALSGLPERKDVASRDFLDKLSRKFVSVAEDLLGEPRPRQVRTIQKFLEKNLSRKLTLGIVSKKFGVKEKALNALVLKHCGMSFTDYIASLRVAEAKRLLQSTDLSHSKIARRTGFKDQSYFTKIFKSQLGCTPTEFRNGLQRTSEERPE